MADRAEDLIGQYLTELFQSTADPTASELPSSPAPPLASQVHSPASPPAPGERDAPCVYHSQPISTQAYERPSPPVPAPAHAVANTPATPAHITLAEPARQQLQQLLNTAWQKPIPAPAQDLPPEAAEPAIAEPPAAPAQSASAPVLEAAPQPSTGKPAWATQTFDSLLVDVAGLKLAIPLVVLGHIFQVQERFAHLPGQGPLFLGAMTTPRGPLRVINTALLVMPERYDPAWVEQVQLVVSLARASGQGQPWQLALAVNRVAQPVTINSDDVVWRGERSKRPWLLGTVKSQMCALLDVDVIGQMMVDPSRP
ncbi:MAG: hypothetical protein U1F46_06815 [Marinagarivorans sp.]